jgi:hypothetical protein
MSGAAHKPLSRRPAAVLLSLFGGLLLSGSAGAYAPGQSGFQQGGALPPQAAPASTPVSTHAFDVRLAQLEKSDLALTKELAQLEPKLDMVHNRMVARGRAYYRMVRAGLLPVGGGFDSLVDHAAAVERLRSALGRDLALEQRMKARKVMATDELRRVKSDKGPLMVQQEAMRRAKTAMQQADERRAAFLRAFGGGSGQYTAGAPHMAVYGASGPVSVGPMVSFSRMKGRLAFPLAGRAEVLAPRAPGDKAVTFVASRDTAVRSVYAGRVVFVGKSEHGLTAVVDHGEQYFSVYSSLTRTEVSMGEVVSERRRLGWVLRTGAQSPSLHFEIRRGRALLDTAPWLGL